MQITEVATPSHEEVVRVTDAEAGLEGVIAIHSTRLGPAAGGLRMRPYASAEAALTDALRLSHGMTLKNAAADLPLGGGKAVIAGDPGRDKTPRLLAAMAAAIERLGGRYWTAEDMGMTPADMAEIRRGTAFVAGLAEGPHASGDPSPVTAQGIFTAIRTAHAHRFGTADLAGRRVAIQGLGNVGRHLARHLFEAGARLVVADVDAARTAEIARAFDAETAAPGEVHGAAADIFAPCAIGAVLNAQTIPELACAIVAGGANNQLATPEDAGRLHARGILYVPDFVANGGGIINVATEVLRIDDPAPWRDARLAALGRTLETILARAAEAGVSPDAVAQDTVEEILRARAA